MKALAFAVVGALWCGAIACSGTESGNPINPPTPPADDIVPAPGVHEGIDEPDPIDSEWVDPFEMPDIMPDLTETAGGQEPPDIEPPDVVDTHEPEPPEVTEPPPLMETPDEPELPPEMPMVVNTAEPMADGEPSAPDPSSAPIAGTAGSASPGVAEPAPGAGGGFGSEDMQTPPASCDESACLAEAEMVAADLSGPKPVPTAFEAAECVAQAESDAGTVASSCSCVGGSGSVRLTADAPGCAVFGRSGDCLYETLEFLGCSPDTDECQQACDDITLRLAEDAALDVQFEVRASQCSMGGDCGFVLEADTQCLLGPALSEVDCGLSDDELLGAP